MAFGFEQLSDDVLASIGASAITAEGRSNQAHVEYLYETNFYPNLPSPYYSSKEYNTSYVSLTAALVAPTSRGNVTVLSNSPADPPQIDPQYYATPEDEAVALHSFKNLRKALAKYAESGLTIGPNAGEVSPGAEIQSDEDIMNHIRETSIQLWHASGTCSMLPHEKGGVVGGDLKVYGVEGLRVVDASVFPVIPDTHIVAATYMLAEKAADMILNQGA